MWWHTPAEALNILRTGEALMTSAPAPAVAAANRQGWQVAMQPLGGLVETRYFAVAKDSPNMADALKLLAFSAEPKRQALLAGQGAWGGVAKGANDGLTPEELARSPSAPAALAAELPLDTQFWAENEQKLTARFDAMVAK